MEFIYDKPKFVSKSRLDGTFSNNYGILLSFDGFEKDKYPFYTVTKHEDSIKLTINTFFSNKIDYIINDFEDRDFLEYFNKNFKYDGDIANLISSSNNYIFYELTDSTLKLIQAQNNSMNEEKSYFLIDEINLSKVRNVEFLNGSIVFLYKENHTLIIDNLDHYNSIYLYRVMRNNLSEVF